jgi:hypothetical protein
LNTGLSDTSFLLIFGNLCSLGDTEVCVCDQPLREFFMKKVVYLRVLVVGSNVTHGRTVRALLV